MRNLYICHCAEFVHLALNGYGSGIQARLEQEICALLDIDRLEPIAAPLQIGTQESYLYPVRGLRGELEDRM